MGTPPTGLSGLVGANLTLSRAAINPPGLQPHARLELERKGAVVLGVSPDGPREHVKFKEKYRLPFTLLSDEEHTVAEQYGTWIEKSMYGKTYMGMERSTFVIDADGNVAKVMRKVKPAEHADDVLAALP
jgi:peroxiredoxin Q/BCP